jgi:hypothetical protein
MYLKVSYNMEMTMLKSVSIMACSVVATRHIIFQDPWGVVLRGYRFEPIC